MKRLQLFNLVGYFIFKSNICTISISCLWKKSDLYSEINKDNVIDWFLSKLSFF